MEEPTTVVNDQPTTGIEGAEAVVETSQPPVATPGTKTDPNLLLKSLQEEREKRRKLEEELQAVKSTAPSEDEVYSDEGRLLKKNIHELEAKIAAIEEEKNLDKLFSQYPLLRDKAEEFRSYRLAEHPRAKIESVAKLFLVENGLMGEQRKGLEQPTGGTRTAPTSDMTAEDVKRLRETNYRKYTDMLMKGQIKV